MARAKPVLVALTLALATACDGDTVNLGTSERMLAGGQAGASGMSGASAGHGGGPLKLWQVDPSPVIPEERGLLLANPTLTDDQNELFFSAQQRSTDNINATTIWRAAPSGGSFGNPVPLKLGSLEMLDASSPAISGDGKELWLGMNLAGTGTDVYRSVRTDDGWLTPQLVKELSSDADDAPRPPALDGTLMALSSKRHQSAKHLYQIYLTSRTPGQAWSEPSQELLRTINSPDYLSADGFLSESGLALYFASTRRSGQDSDLYVARRASIEAPFGEPEPLVDLNTDAEERMPWVSPAGDRVYFVSDRDLKYAQYALYVASRL
jgi:hypothetical protein